jgi:hypothetical protein
MMVRRSLSTFLLASAGLFVATGIAHADWCVDLRTGQNYDCAKEPPSGKAPAQGNAASTGLREQLRRSLGNQANTPPAPDRLAIAQRVEDASQRADNALRSAELTSDPAEKAQAKKNYDAAMADLRSSTQQLIDATPDPAQKQALAQALKDSEARHASMAADVGLGGAAPAAPAVAAAPTANVFSVCEAPEKGVTTCYEIGRSGSACQKVFYQGGQLTWRDSQMSTCGAGDLAQRDAFFAGKPVGGEPPAAPAVDPRSEQLAGMMAGTSAQCQSDLRNYLYSSRDSKSSRGAETNAMKSFVNIEKDPECKAVLDRLASSVGVEMPQRRLASQSRKTWDSAMADKPRAEIAVPTGEYMANGYYSADGAGNGDGYNTGEVVNAGIQILGVLGDILGGFASGYGGGGYTSRPAGVSRTYGQGSPSGSGYVYRGNSGGNNSTITGTR